MRGLTITQAQARKRGQATKQTKPVAIQHDQDQNTQGVGLGAVVAAAAVGAVIGNAMARSDTPPVVNPVEPGREHDCGL
jgi:hypothetical protein